MKKVMIYSGSVIGLCVWHLMATVLGAQLVAIGRVPEVADEQLGLIGFLVVSLVETLAMISLLVRLNLTGLRLLGVAFLIFHGTRTFMMMIEALFYLNIWTSPEVMTLGQLGTAQLQGLLMAILYCPVLVWSLRLWRSKKHTAPSTPHEHAHLRSNSWLARLGMVSVIYALCYMLAGIFILVPLAGESFQETYKGLDVPLWMPLFQVGRGLVWAVMLVPVVAYFTGPPWQRHAIIGLTLAILSSAQLLYPNPYMGEALRYAHAIELIISMFVFGGLASMVLDRTRKAFLNVSENRTTS